MSTIESDIQRQMSERAEELQRIAPQNAGGVAPKTRSVGLDELDNLRVDSEGNLYWHDRPIMVRRRLELRGWELMMLGLTMLGTMLSGLVAVAEWAGWYPLR